MRKILVIDDEKDFCHFIKESLEATGEFEVSTCNDSTQGLKAAKTQRPDLILLDIMMPKVDGTDIASGLKADKEIKDIPFVFITAAIRKAEAEREDHVIGGEHFVAKPVEISKLIDLINRLTAEGG